MAKITLEVGESGSSRSGFPWSSLKKVEFEAEFLADDKDTRDENRPYTTTLYRTPDRRLIVYEEAETRMQGETSSYRLIEVKPEELGLHGRFWYLGNQLEEFSRPLTLDEALAE